MEDVVLHSISHISMSQPTRKKFDLSNECEALFHNKPIVVKVEEESEQMTDAFLSSGDNLDEFLEAYHEKRKLAHLRRVKVIIVSLFLEKNYR